MGELTPIDLVFLGVLAIAALRGLLIGMIREAFSIGAVAAAVVTVRLGSAPLAERLLASTDLGLGDLGTRVLAGAAIAILTIALVTTFGRFLRRGMRVMGLGMMDRLAGGALGAAEGALVAAILLIGMVNVLGPAHPLLARSRSLEVFEQVERIAQERSRQSDVASPPPERGT